MKILLLPCFIIALTACSSANLGGKSTVNESVSTARKSLKTVMTCLEDDGDQWTSVGIVRQQQGALLALVIKNNVDDDTAKVESSFSVDELGSDTREVSYVDDDGAFRLTVSADGTGALRGELLLPESEGDGIFIERMNCFKNDDISFEGSIPAKSPEKPTKTLKTEITCRQEDGDQVRTIGIVKEQRGFSAVVVDQNFDDGTQKLARVLAVTLNTDAPEQSVWSGNRGSFSLRLTVKENAQGRLTGELKSSDRSEPISGLECIPDDKITFDSK
jgi:hypothetical protein